MESLVALVLGLVAVLDKLIPFLTAVGVLWALWNTHTAKKERAAQAVAIGNVRDNVATIEIQNNSMRDKLEKKIDEAAYAAGKTDGAAEQKVVAKDQAAEVKAARDGR